MAKRRLNVNLTNLEHRFLKQLADLKGVSMTKVIRKWIGEKGGPYMEDRDSRFKLSKGIRPFPPTPEELCTLLMQLLQEYPKIEEVSVKAGKPVVFSYWMDKDNYVPPNLSIYDMLRRYPIDDVTGLTSGSTAQGIFDHMVDTMVIKNYRPVCVIVNKVDPWEWYGSFSDAGKRKSLFLGYPVLHEPQLGEDRILLAGSAKRELGTGAACYAVQVAVDTGVVDENITGDEGNSDEEE